MFICPCSNCRTSGGIVHSGIGWLLLLAAAAGALRWLHGLLESIAWALIIPTAVVAAVMIAVVTRMVVRSVTQAGRPTPVQASPVTAPAPSASVPGELVLTPLDDRMAALIRAKSTAN